MTPSQLDFFFPFIVLFYGVVITFLLHSPFFVKLAETRLPSPLLGRFFGHRALGIVCLVVGAIWSLQNLFFS